MAKIIDVTMRLQDRVTGPLGRIRRQLEETARVHQRLGKEVSRVGRSMESMGKTLMPAALGIASAGGVALKTFADFDYTITQAGLKAGATAEEMGEMRKVAAEIGRDFPITASQAAQAMDRLAASGLDAKQSMGALPGIVTAAVASGEDLGATADVITSALATYNMMTGDVGANTSKVADIIQMAANRSKLDMAAFGTAMQYAGAPAAALGVDIESLSTAMGIMANNGIEASTIGTSLRATLSRLAKPPKEAANAIQQLGLQVKGANGNFTGLDNVVNQMRRAMEGMSNTEQVAIAKAIAGEDAYSGLLALIRTAPGDYKKLENAIRHARGSSKEAADVMNGTTKGSFMSMMGSVESLAISVGDLLSPAFGAATSAIKQATDWINNLSDDQKMMILNVLKGVLAFVAFNMAAGRVVSIGGRLISLYGDIGAAAKGMTISNRLLMYTVRGAVKLFPVLSSGLSTVLKVLGGAGSSAIVGAVRLLSALRTGILLVGKALFTASVAGGPIMWVIMAIALAAMLIYANWDKLGPIFTAIWAEVVNTFTWAYNGVMDFIDSLIAAFNGIVDFITGAFTGAWTAAWTTVTSVFTEIFSGIEGVCCSVMNGIRAAINAVISAINGISVDIPDWVPGVGGGHLGFNIPMLYTGTPNWRGGPAVINDRGGEVVDLPSGARVIPHEQSLNQAYRQGRMAGANSGSPNISVNIINPQINNQGDIEKLAEQVAARIYYELAKNSINMNEGAV